MLLRRGQDGGLPSLPQREVSLIDLAPPVHVAFHYLHPSIDQSKALIPALHLSFFPISSQMRSRESWGKSESSTNITKPKRARRPANPRLCRDHPNQIAHRFDTFLETGTASNVRICLALEQEPREYCYSITVCIIRTNFPPAEAIFFSSLFYCIPTPYATS